MQIVSFKCYLGRLIVYNFKVRQKLLNHIEYLKKLNHNIAIGIISEMHSAHNYLHLK